MSAEGTGSQETPLGPPVARGRTADIHAWGDGEVLKLYHDWFGLESIEYELRMAQAVSAAGLPAPRPGQIVWVNGRNGLTYERIDGISLLEGLQREPWLVIHHARQCAQLHAQMHADPFRPEIPAQRSRLEKKIGQASALPADLKSAALRALEGLPDGDRLCHGDFHPGNILQTKAGLITIDWIDATRGNPLADVARSTIILLGAAASSQIPNPLTKASIRLFHAAYLRQYFRLRPGGEQEYRRWLPVVAAARLSEQIPELEGWLIAQARGV